MALNPCKACGGTPVEQTRGQMNPEDHHAQFLRLEPAAAARKVGILIDLDDLHNDVYDVEDQGEDHATDMRVSCPKCGNATGWDRRDIEEFRDLGAANPGHKIRVPKTPHGNVENIRKRWNDANPVK